MNDLALAIEEARAAVASAAGEFMPDLCDIEGPTLVDGGAAGDSVSRVPLASNIPCRVKALGGGRQIVVGGRAYTVSHRLQLPRTATTSLISPEHRATVKARGNTPDRIFENLIADEDSLAPMLWVSASVVTQGYQQ